LDFGALPCKRGIKKTRSHVFTKMISTKRSIDLVYIVPLIVILYLGNLPDFVAWK
jgi:hypothetical protein